MERVDTVPWTVEEAELLERLVCEYETSSCARIPWKDVTRRLNSVVLDTGKGQIRSVASVRNRCLRSRRGKAKQEAGQRVNLCAKCKLPRAGHVCRAQQIVD